jgi:hypothetical protein
MQFTQAAPDENFPLGRWVSENNIWELGFYPVLFGVRVKLGKVGSPCVNLNYCAGNDEGFALILLATVALILEAVPESVTERQIERLFPGYTIKPINLDPTCWKQLQELGETSALFRQFSTQAAKEGNYSPEMLAKFDEFNKCIQLEVRSRRAAQEALSHE